jgi:hypothetical protein
MAKLPEIDYTTPVQESSGSYAQLNEAQKQTANVFAQGFHAFGTELVKSQSNRAAADLLSGLENATIDLRTQKTISASQLKAALGSDYDSLPPEIKAQTTQSVLNPETGAYEDKDREDIPMFAVAGHIFDARSKKLLADSVSKFSSAGWAAEFQDKAAQEILQKKMNLSLHTMYDAHEFLQQQDAGSAIDAANAGAFGQAKQILAGSRAMNPKTRLELESHVDKIQQTRPLYEALRTGNVADMAKLLPALGDEKQFTKLSGEERLSFTNRLESEIKSFYDGIRKADDTQLHANAEQGWNGIFAKERARQPVSYQDIPMPGTVKADAQKAMIEYVDKLNKGEKPETDWRLYAGLLDQARTDRQKFASTNVLNYRNRLADPEFKQLLDLQMGIKGGNPDAYDHFQTTDEAIDTRLRMGPYKIDPKDKDKQDQVGYVKTQVQRALAREQEAKGGKPLSLEDRDRVIDATLKDTIDPRKEGFIFNDAASIPAFKAGVSPTVASTFQKAVTALYPREMAGDADKKVKKLKEQYEDYNAIEPHIEKAWMIQRGKAIDPNDAVQAWYYIRMNRDRLEGTLRSSGELSGNKAAQDFKVTNLAIYELLQRAR